LLTAGHAKTHTQPSRNHDRMPQSMGKLQITFEHAGPQLNRVRMLTKVLFSLQGWVARIFNQSIRHPKTGSFSYNTLELSIQVGSWPLRVRLSPIQRSMPWGSSGFKF
jgi:hypothetical protein